MQSFRLSRHNLQYEILEAKCVLWCAGAESACELRNPVHGLSRHLPGFQCYECSPVAITWRVIPDQCSHLQDYAGPTDSQYR